MLHYVVREPKVKTEYPPLLVLLHGYGSNELDLFSFADELPENLLIISARAPYKMAFGGYSWYEISLDASNNKHSNLDEAKESIKKIAHFIETIKEKHKTDSRNTFLLGFSQGAILSYAFSFQYPNIVQHILALSGYINEDLLPAKPSEDLINTDYYISHGTVDQVLPVDLARKAPSILSNLKLKNTYTEYPVGHGVAPQNFFSLKKWIEERI